MCKIQAEVITTQLYSHQHLQPPLKLILFSTLNLLNKPRAFLSFHIHIYLYIFPPHMLSFVKNNCVERVSERENLRVT